jgi:hypothetical protein
MICEDEISFIVQGPIIKNGDNSTHNVLKSIRANFPHSEIILSSWIGEDAKGLEYDHLVLSEIPPSLNLYEKHQCNINRQIVSTVEGIKVSTKKYILKTRTNTLFENNQLLTIFDKKSTNSVFENLVLTIDLFSRDQYKSTILSYCDGFLHHPSDILLLGLKKDILELFSCPFATKETMLNRNGLGILAPEQYLWMDLLIRKGKIRNFKNSLVRYNPIACFKSERLLFENFKIRNHQTLGLVLEDRLINGWMFESVIEESFQLAIEQKNSFKKNCIYLKRAIYYCLIVNHFWRKINNSIKRKRKKYKYLFICKR